MSEEAKHTKGPWRRDYGGGYGKGHIYAEDPKFGGDSLAAAHLPPLYESGKGGLNEEAFAIMEANARLIAAAPALLDACKKLLGIVRHEAAEHSDCNYKFAVKEAEAALALAEPKGA